MREKDGIASWIIRGSKSDRGEVIVFSSKRPDRLWDLTSIYFIMEGFPGYKVARV